MTQLEFAKKKIITRQMQKVARQENLPAELILEGISKGTIVIPSNKNRKASKICGIGEGLKTKVNANIGTSTNFDKISYEIKKLKTAISFGADTVMDLSTAGNLTKIRQAILKNSSLPVGTVPIYEAAISAKFKYGNLSKMTIEDILDTLETQAREGVDFFTIHAGVTLSTLNRLRASRRIIDIVSRGGAFIIEWMCKNRRENPLYENFDRILDIAYRYDVTLSLGDGLRPGCVADASDRPQFQELILLGELAKQANERNVQVIIEGPGHVPLNQIEANVLMEKKLCHNAPFYVLGPLVTDVAPGYDHITAAIGGALAASFGADFLCYVTPSEHLGLPTVDDVKEGVIATRIAAHAADIAKGIKDAINWDIDLSIARKKRNWKRQFELAIDSKKAKRIRTSLNPKLKDFCTMCGEYCSMKLIDEML